MTAEQSVRPALAVLLSAAVAVGVAGCATPEPAPPVVLPTGGNTLVAQWHETGGLASIGMRQIDAPRLAVFADGRAVLDARKVIKLAPAEVTALVGTLRAGLSQLSSVVTPDSDQHISDLTRVELRVLAADATMRVVSAQGLGMYPAETFPAGLVAADTAMHAIIERVDRDGTAFATDRVRVLVDVALDARGTLLTWPSLVPVPGPPATSMSDAGQVGDYAGAEAAAVVKDLADCYDEFGANPGQRRLYDGSVVDVSWRYLLPSE